jgi:hypothetical protein
MLSSATRRCWHGLKLLRAMLFFKKGAAAATDIHSFERKTVRLPTWWLAILATNEKVKACGGGGGGGGEGGLTQHLCVSRHLPSTAPPFYLASFLSIRNTKM